MTTAQELTQKVIEAAKDTPYVVTQTDSGFEVSLNIVDAKWVLPLGTGKTKEYFRITAELDEATHTATLNDSLYQLEWSAGTDGNLVPHVGASLQVQQGEIHERQFGVVIGMPGSKQGDTGVTTYSFSSDKAKGWLKGLLIANGWKKKWGLQAKIGLIVGLVVIAIGVVGSIIVLVNKFK